MPEDLTTFLNTAGFTPRYEQFDICHLQPSGYAPENYHENLAAIRDSVGVAPVWFVQDLIPCYVITRHDDVVAAFKDMETFSPELTQSYFTFPITGEQILGFEGQKHIQFRKVVSRNFNRAAAKNYISDIFTPRARETVRKIKDRAGSSGESIDLMEEFGHQYPMAIISDLLGLPTDEWDQMVHWAEKIILGGADPDGQKVAAQAFRDYLEPVIESRRAAPEPDLLTTLVTGRVFGKPLTEEQVIAFMLLLFPAGIDTTWLSIGSMMAAILAQPDAKQRLLEDPGMRYWAVEETLRWEAPTPLIPRLTKKDVEVAGVHIPAHSLAILGIGPANRTPGRYGDTDPAEWDLDRKPEGHLAFSIGEHFCLGANIARSELQVALDVLLDELPGMELAEEPVFAGAAIRGPASVKVRI